jgi:hypothetical protein
LWADTVEDEAKIWNQFLDVVASTENPVLIHYGSYEVKFLELEFSRSPIPSQPVNLFNLEHFGEPTLLWNHLRSLTLPHRLDGNFCAL